MVRIAGRDLPANKRVEIGLTYIYGINHALAGLILKKSEIDPGLKVKDLTEENIISIRDVIRDLRLEGDLRKDVSMNIKRLIDIGAYRGERHRRKLPARGQRTKTNARTNRGGRKTVGSGRRKAEGKT